MRRSEAAALRWADVRKAADGRGLLVAVRRSNQEGTAADVRYLKNGAAAAVWAIRPPAPADDASVLGGLTASQSPAASPPPSGPPASRGESPGTQGGLAPPPSSLPAVPAPPRPCLPVGSVPPALQPSRAPAPSTCKARSAQAPLGPKSDMVRPVYRFNFPRLAAVLITATFVFAACAQGPGTAGPRGPSDTAPTFAVTVADQTYTEGEAVSPLTLPEASGGNGTLSYSLAPTVPGLTFTAATRTLSGTPTSAGSYDMTFQAVDADDNTAASDAAMLSFTITVQEPAPPDTAPAFAVTVADQTYTEGEAISPLTLPEASGGNGTLSYSLTPTVPGLTFAAATHTLSGTPTSAGSYDMTYQAVDGDNNTAASDAATLTFTITVQEPEPPDTAPAFADTVDDQTYTEGEAVSPLTLPEASGGNGTLSYSLTPSVPGLTFTAATRALSGTPTAAGTYNMTYRAADGDANTAVSDAATLTFTITVQEPEPPDTAPAFADTVDDQTYTEGEAVSPLTLPEASGGNGTLSYSLTPSVPGLTFTAATRALSGTPTAAGTYNMTYRAADGDANTAVSDAATLTFTITVQVAGTA